MLRSFSRYTRAIVIQRNSMDPVVADVDNGLLLPPPNRRISFVSARPPTSFQVIENSGSSASPNFGRVQPRADREIDTNRFPRSKSLCSLFIRESRFSKWIVLSIRFRKDRCDRRFEWDCNRCGWIDFANNEIIIIICKRREETRIKITMNLRNEEKYFNL